MCDFQPRLISVDKLLRVRVSAKGVAAAEQVHGEYSKYTTAEVISLDRTVIGGIAEFPCGPPALEVIYALLCSPPSVEIMYAISVKCTMKLVEVLLDCGEIYLISIWSVPQESYRWTVFASGRTCRKIQ